jgi:hypothetical protein
VSTARTVTPRIKRAFVIFMVSATFFIVFIELHAFYPFSVALDQGFSKGVPRNFWTVPREKVLEKCEHIKKGLCIIYLSSVTY